MIIAIGGTAGAGKSTAARLVAERLKLRHYSIGDLTRQLAKKKGMPLLELSRQQEKDRSIDIEIDKMQIKLGKEKNSFVIDSRLGFHFIPHADLKVFLDAKPGERARRIWKEKRKDEAAKDKKAVSLRDIMALIKRRESSEKIRYRKYYNLNPWHKKHYDLVLDTTNMKIGGVVERIIGRIKNTPH